MLVFFDCVFCETVFFSRHVFTWFTFPILRGLHTSCWLKCIPNPDVVVKLLI